MKTNIEKTTIVEDVNVEIRFGKDDNGVVQMIDFMTYCPECDAMHVAQRFISVDDETLQDMLEEEDYDEWDDFDDEFHCDCDECIAERKRRLN